MAVLDPANKKFISYFLPVIIWAGFIFAVSSTTGNKIPHLFAYQDIVFHIFEYAVFAWFIHRALKNYYPNLPNFRCFYLTVIVSIIYAISDELHQAYVPYRDPSALDAMIDTLGAIAGSLFFYYITKRSVIGSRKDNLNG